MVITRTTVVEARNITVYRNACVPHALVAVNENRFGRGPITSARIERVEARDFRPVHETPKINATPASFGPDSNRGIQPFAGSLQRPMVATHSPRTTTERAAGGAPNMGPAAAAGPAPRIVGILNALQSVLAGRLAAAVGLIVLSYIFTIFRDCANTRKSSTPSGGRGIWPPPAVWRCLKFSLIWRR